MPQIHAGTNVGLHVKKTVQSKWKLTVWQFLIKLYGIKVNENLLSGSQVISHVKQVNGWSEIYTLQGRKRK